MRRFSSLLLGLTLLAASPLAALAAPGDLYADALTVVSNQAYQAENALGAPDEVYMTFLEEDAYVTFDMGADESGKGNLTITYLLLSASPTVRIELLDAGMSVLATGGNFLPIGENSFTMTYDGATPYRFVRITSTSGDVWKLDALQAASYELPSESVPPSPPPIEQGQPPVVTYPQGLIVKLVDDGNPDTWSDAAVYVIDGVGKRHVFPNEPVYRTWYPSDATLAFIDGDQLATYALGANVTVRPGTWLVKVTTDPKVYAVEPGGVLRWVASEDIAKALYGENWAKRVIDVSDVFFTNYQVGQAIETKVHPNGTVGALPSGRIVYVRNSVTYTIPGSTLDQMRWDPKFSLVINEDVADLYVDGGDLVLTSEIRWPY